MRQLGLRFGPVTDEVQSRIADADLATLERWFGRLATAASLNDVFEG